jgi:hypothetical protein
MSQALVGPAGKPETKTLIGQIKSINGLQGTPITLTQL